MIDDLRRLIGRVLTKQPALISLVYSSDRAMWQANLKDPNTGAYDVEVRAEPIEAMVTVLRRRDDLINKRAARKRRSVEGEFL